MKDDTFLDKKAYDPPLTRIRGTPDWLEAQRRITPGPFLIVRPHQGKSWCEGCQRYKEKPLGKVVKGWRCLECKSKKNER